MARRARDRGVPRAAPDRAEAWPVLIEFLQKFNELDVATTPEDRDCASTRCT